MGHSGIKSFGYSWMLMDNFWWKEVNFHIATWSQPRPVFSPASSPTVKQRRAGSSPSPSPSVGSHQPSRRTGTRDRGKPRGERCPCWWHLCQAVSCSLSRAQQGRAQAALPSPWRREVRCLTTRCFLAGPAHSSQIIHEQSSKPLLVTTCCAFLR